MDLIDRQAALEVLKNNRYRFNISQEGCCEGKVLWSENLIKDDACKEIEQLSSVTPTQKIGRWEWVQYDYNPKLGDWRCSECRCVVVECVDKEENGGIPLYKYCPECGAKLSQRKEVKKHEKINL